MRAPALLALLLCTTPAHAGDSYLIERDGGTTSEPTVAEFQYSERFAVMSVALSTDGREVAATNRTAPDGVQAWRLKDGRGGRVPKVSGAPMRVAYANAAPRIAVALSADPLSEREGMIELSDLSTGKLGPTLRGASDVRAIAFSPDNNVVLAALPEGVRAWDLREGSSRDLLRLRGGADTVSFSNANEAYASADNGAVIYRIALPGGEILEEWKGKRADGPVGISPGGRYLAAAADDGRVKIHDLKEGGTPRKLDIGAAVTSITWATGGRLLAVGTKDGDVRVYEVDSDPLPMGFADTARLDGRGGGVIGGWDGEDRAAGRLGDEDDRGRGVVASDRAFEQNASGDLRMNLEMGREEKRGPSAGGVKKSRGNTGPFEVAVTSKVIVIDQMGGDPREARDLQAALAKNAKRLTRCWRQAQRAGEPVLGTLIFEMGITPEGEGVGIGSPIEDGIGSEKLLSCLEGRLREALFGPGLGSMDVRLELIFDVAE